MGVYTHGFPGQYFGNTGNIDKKIDPGSVTIEWTIGATTYSLTDDGAGSLTGDGEGRVFYGFNTVRIKPNPAPRPVDGDYTVTVDRTPDTDEITETITPIPDEITHNASGADIREGSVIIKAWMLRKKAQITADTPEGSREESIQVTAYDDGDGNLLRDGVVIGSINYLAASVTFDFRSGYDYEEQEDGTAVDSFIPREFSTTNTTEEYDTDEDIEISYVESTAIPQTEVRTIPIPALDLDLVQGNGKPVIPGSLVFTFAGKTYIDRNGSILTDVDAKTNAGTSVGSINYTTGVASLDDWPAEADVTQAPELLSGLTYRGERTTYYSKFRTDGAPLRQGSLIINATTEDGTEISVQADNAGDLTHPKIDTGTVDYQTGIVTIEWTDPIFPSTVSYSAVAFTYLPLDSEILGLNPTRLPSDGRVPIYLPGDVVVISHTAETEVASPTAGATETLSRDHQAEIWVVGANGLTLDPAQYTLDREAGELTWADPLTLETEDEEAVTTPVTIFDRVEDMALLTDVQISGLLTFNAQLSQDYPADEAVISSAVLHGDLRARVYNLFHQSGWTGVWSDERIGNDTTAKYNDIVYPVEITNQGSIKERWRISFTSSTGFQVIGETVGVVGTGTTSVDCAIENPATGVPYFVIRADGWGSGWNSGNQVRFNTDGAQAPFWLARTVLSGPATEDEDSFATQNRGDAG